MWRDVIGIIVLAAAVGVCAFTGQGRADTLALCASPGPHGEALYCVGDADDLPTILAPRAEPRVLKGLDSYERGTGVVERRRGHRWQVTEEPRRRPRRIHCPLRQDALDVPSVVEVHRPYYGDGPKRHLRRQVNGGHRGCRW